MKQVFLCCLMAGLIASSTAFSAIETKGKYALLMDADTGYVMLDKKADIPMPPASMSKLMTVYMIFNQLKAGKITMDTEWTVSENAWKKGGTKSGSSTMFLRPYQKVKVGDLIRGILVQSGNDACIVAAENMAGSEDVFAEIMTRKAREIGLKTATFKNATGLPQEGHALSAYDLAKLAQILINEFPEYYPIFSEKEFTYNKIKQGNRNPLLYEIEGADGLKTGHTEKSGFGLTGSVKTADGRRLILVVNGLKTMQDRRTETKKLMGWGIGAFENINMYQMGQTVEQIPVWLGTKPTVPVTLDQSVAITVSKGEEAAVRAEIQYTTPVSAPVQKGQKLGEITVYGPENQIRKANLIAMDDVAKVGYFGKLKAVIGSWFGQK